MDKYYPIGPQKGITKSKEPLSEEKSVLGPSTLPSEVKDKWRMTRSSNNTRTIDIRQKSKSQKAGKQSPPNRFAQGEIEGEEIKKTRTNGILSKPVCRTKEDVE